MTLNSLLSYTKPIVDYQLIPDSGVLIVALPDALHIYHMPIAHQPTVVPPPMPGVPVRQIIESPNSRFLALAGNDVFLFVPTTRSWRKIFTSPDKDITFLRASNNLILILRDAKDVLILDGHTHEGKYQCVLQTERVVDCVVCAENGTAVIVTAENTIRFLSMSSGHVERTCNVEAPCRVAFSPKCDCGIAWGAGFTHTFAAQTDETRGSIPKGVTQAVMLQNWALVTAVNMGLQSLFLYAIPSFEPVATLTIHNVNIVRVLGLKGGKGESVELLIQGDDGTISYWTFCPDRDEEQRLIPLPQFPTQTDLKDAGSVKKKPRERTVSAKVPIGSPQGMRSFSAAQISPQVPQAQAQAQAQVQRRKSKGSPRQAQPVRLPLQPAPMMMYPGAYRQGAQMPVAPQTPPPARRLDEAPGRTMPPRMTLISGLDDLTISPDGNFLRSQSQEPPATPPPPASAEAQEEKAPAPEQGPEPEPEPVAEEKPQADGTEEKAE